VVDNSSLMPVVTAFAVARQTVRSIKQNLIMSLAYNTTMMLLAGGVLIAFGFALNPAIGVGLMVLQAALVLANQYRIKRQQLPHLNRFEQEMKAINKQPDNGTYKSLQQNGLQLHHKSGQNNTSDNYQSSYKPLYSERTPIIKANESQNIRPCSFSN
jgi:P-type Cu2+ transporter